MSTLTIGLHDGCPCIRLGRHPEAPWWIVMEMRTDSLDQLARYLMQRPGSPEVMEVLLLHDGGWACCCREEKPLAGCSHVKALRLLRQFYSMVKPSEPLHRSPLDATGDWPVIVPAPVPGRTNVLGTYC